MFIMDYLPRWSNYLACITSRYNPKTIAHSVHKARSTYIIDNFILMVRLFVTAGTVDQIIALIADIVAAPNMKAYEKALKQYQNLMKMRIEKRPTYWNYIKQVKNYT